MNRRFYTSFCLVPVFWARLLALLFHAACKFLPSFLSIACGFDFIGKLLRYQAKYGSFQFTFYYFYKVNNNIMSIIGTLMVIIPFEANFYHTLDFRLLAWHHISNLHFSYKLFCFCFSNPKDSNYYLDQPFWISLSCLEKI